MDEATKGALREMLARYERGDFGGWDPFFADDLLLTGFNADGAGQARGPAEIEPYLRGFFEQFSGYRIEVGTIEELGEDAALMEGRQFATGRLSGIEIDETLFVVFRFADGRLTEMHWHPEREGALRAAGLEG